MLLGISEQDCLLMVELRRYKGGTDDKWTWGTMINGTINDNDIPDRSTAHNSLPDAFMIGVSLCFQKIKETNDVII